MLSLRFFSLKQIIILNFNGTFKLDFNVFYLSSLRVIEDKSLIKLSFFNLLWGKKLFEIRLVFESSMSWIFVGDQKTVGIFPCCLKFHKIEMLWWQKLLNLIKFPREVLPCMVWMWGDNFSRSVNIFSASSTAMASWDLIITLLRRLPIITMLHFCLWVSPLKRQKIIKTDWKSEI